MIRISLLSNGMICNPGASMLVPLMCHSSQFVYLSGLMCAHVTLILVVLVQFRLFRYYNSFHLIAMKR